MCTFDATIHAGLGEGSVDKNRILGEFSKKEKHFMAVGLPGSESAQSVELSLSRIDDGL